MSQNKKVAKQACLKRKGRDTNISSHVLSLSKRVNCLFSFSAFCLALFRLANFLTCDLYDLLT